MNINTLPINRLFTAFFILFLLNDFSFGQGNISLTCRFVSCEQYDSISLMMQDGLGYKLVAHARKNADGAYIFNIPAGAPRYYEVGPNETQLARVILGKEANVNLWGNCAMLSNARTMNSAPNKSYETVIKKYNAWREQLSRTKEGLKTGRNNGFSPDESEQIFVSKLINIASAKRKFRDSLLTANPDLGKIAALYCNPEYEEDKKGFDYEGEFAGKEYFNGVNLADPFYNTVPELYNAFIAFVQSITLSGAGSKTQGEWGKTHLSRIPLGSQAYKFAIAGLISGFQSVNNPTSVELINTYVEQFKGKDNGEINRLEFELARSRTSMPGMEAPDLVGQTPEGGSLALKSLRGKYVLVDFWASWCGPCRKENPNVKAAYEKFKDKGFEVFGVSLDRTKEAWVNAIQADGLPWKHISDLKGWQSDLARLYSVSSIPQTVLLDPNGKIVQRNLRGDQLTMRLEEIFKGK